VFFVATEMDMVQQSSDLTGQGFTIEALDAIVNTFYNSVKAEEVSIPLALI
jgi:hypothetical protein